MVALISDGRIAEVEFVVRRQWCARVQIVDVLGVLETNAQLMPSGAWRYYDQHLRKNLELVVVDNEAIPVTDGDMTAT